LLLVANFTPVRVTGVADTRLVKKTASIKLVNSFLMIVFLTTGLEKKGVFSLIFLVNRGLSNPESPDFILYIVSASGYRCFLSSGSLDHV
jgi:hypothetical protein